MSLLEAFSIRSQHTVPVHVTCSHCGLESLIRLTNL